MKLMVPGRLIGNLIFLIFFKRKFETSFSREEPTFGKGVEEQIPNIKIGILMNEYIVRNNVKMNHELLYAYEASARQYGIKPEVLGLEYLLETHSNIESLKTFIRQKRINVLILLGDSMLQEHPGLSKAFISELRNELRIKVVVHLADSPGMQGVKLIEFWQDVADIIVTHTSSLSTIFPKIRNLFFWPSIPYPEKLLMKYVTHNKNREILFSGSLHRYRNNFADYIEKLGLPCRNIINSRTQNSFSTTDFESYFQSLSKSALVFANGYRSRKDSEIVARVTEVMLAKSVLLYESGSDIDFFFEPYIHYVPIYNFADLYLKSRFLLDNPKICEKISNSASDIMNGLYSSDRFWQLLLKNLFRES